LNIEKREDLKGNITLHLSGRIDTTTSAQLRTAITGIPGDVGRLVLDFRDVPYITSAGLRELLICRKRFPGEQMLIVNVNTEIMEIFAMTGFDSVLPLENEQKDESTYIDLSFKELLAHHVRQNGTKAVLMNEDGCYTWEDIDRASQIIADDLSGLGVKSGVRVGICGNNSVNWVLTFYAVQKLGAIAMLVNPGLSAAEIGQVCALGDITILCCGELAASQDEGTLLRELQQVKGCLVEKLYSFKNDKDLRLRFAEYDALRGKFEQTVDPDAPCVVIFTSGSTGKPKGVILSAYNLLNASAVQVRMQRMTPEDKELLIVPLFHILGLVVCFLPCAMTDTVLYIPHDIRTSTLIRAMEQEHCTLMHSVPTLILAIINNKSYDPRAFSSLRCTYLAGAAVTEAQIAAFQEKMPNNHFMIAYGLSEMAPVTVTEYEDSIEHILHTVGRQVENIHIQIADRVTGRICAAGEIGEILVQGFNLMTGYYKLPLEDQAIDGDGWLHTGDMGSLDEDNYLTLHGRYKELIIRGGENIMPREVEEAVASVPGVDDVKVFGVPSDFYGEEVAACVKLLPGNAWNEAEVREILSGKLARYKVPRWFCLFEEFPMLGSGKIDGVALRQDAIARITRS
jgi:fatty-acyl-CoA synthase